jgi:hypothetical protein
MWEHPSTQRRRKAWNRCKENVNPNPWGRWKECAKACCEYRTATSVVIQDPSVLGCCIRRRSNMRSGTSRGPRYPTERRALRAKLGLPPLHLPSSLSSGGGGGGGGGGAAAADRVAGGGGFVHAPAPDTSKADGGGDLTKVAAVSQK